MLNKYTKSTLTLATLTIIRYYGIFSFKLLGNTEVGLHSLQNSWYFSCHQDFLPPATSTKPGNSTIQQELNSTYQTQRRQCSHYRNQRRDAEDREVTDNFCCYHMMICCYHMMVCCYHMMVCCYHMMVSCYHRSICCYHMTGQRNNQVLGGGVVWGSVFSLSSSCS